MKEWTQAAILNNLAPTRTIEEKNKIVKDYYTELQNRWAKTAVPVMVQTSNIIVEKI